MTLGWGGGWGDNRKCFSGVWTFTSQFAIVIFTLGAAEHKSCSHSCSRSLETTNRIHIHGACGDRLLLCPKIFSQRFGHSFRRSPRKASRSASLAKYFLGALPIQCAKQVSRFHFMRNFGAESESWVFERLADTTLTPVIRSPDIEILAGWAKPSTAVFDTRHW